MNLQFKITFNHTWKLIAQCEIAKIQHLQSTPWEKKKYLLKFTKDVSYRYALIEGSRYTVFSGIK